MQMIVKLRLEKKVPIWGYPSLYKQNFKSFHKVKTKKEPGSSRLLYAMRQPSVTGIVVSPAFSQDDYV